MQSISEVIVNHDPVCPHCGKTIYTSESRSGRPAYKKPRDRSAMVQFEKPPKDQKELSVLEILFESLVFWIFWPLFFLGPLFNFRDVNNEAGS